MNRQDLENEIEIRKTFRTVFGSGPGKEALTLILNRLGYFSQDPGKVHPELIAAANWLLGALGSVHPGNLFLMTDRIVDCANDTDIQALLKETEYGRAD